MYRRWAALCSARRGALKACISRIPCLYRWYNTANCFLESTLALDIPCILCMKLSPHPSVALPLTHHLLPFPLSSVSPYPHVQGASIFVRGRLVRDALFKHLLSEQGLKDASKVGSPHSYAWTCQYAVCLPACLPAQVCSCLCALSASSLRIQSSLVLCAADSAGTTTSNTSSLRLQTAAASCPPAHVTLPTLASSSLQVVITGCSAGGLASLLHCDHIKHNFLPSLPHTSYACMPDAGVFLDM